MEKIDRIIKNGLVAVAISPGFGAGWSTWNDVSPLDPEFNQLFLDEKWQEAYLLADEREIYSSGIRDIEIEWVPVGSKFIIDEYDGAEKIIFEGELDWIIV